jgi:hypothetical protein
MKPAPLKATRSIPEATPEASGLRCFDSKVRALLLSYAFSGCEEDDAVAFEVHVLSCEACYRDLQCLHRASDLLGEFRTSAPQAFKRLVTNLRQRPPSHGGTRFSR